ncbi:MAG: hypothetical protein K6F00_11085 [Lachnospiraceae bacterium]|nr:hypothetical protein [Lachnospiraceae bacterium]
MNAKPIEVTRGDEGYYILWKDWNLSNAYTREECINTLKARRKGREVLPITGHRTDTDLVALCKEVMEQS